MAQLGRAGRVRKSCAKAAHLRRNGVAVTRAGVRPDLRPALARPGSWDPARGLAPLELRHSFASVWSDSGPPVEQTSQLVGRGGSTSPSCCTATSSVRCCRRRRGRGSAVHAWGPRCDLMLSLTLSLDWSGASGSDGCPGSTMCIVDLCPPNLFGDSSPCLARNVPRDDQGRSSTGPRRDAPLRLSCSPGRRQNRTAGPCRRRFSSRDDDAPSGSGGVVRSAAGHVRVDPGRHGGLHVAAHHHL